MSNKIVISDYISPISEWYIKQPFTNIPALSVLETKSIQLTTSAWKTNPAATSDLQIKSVQLNVNSWKTKPAASSDLENKAVQLNADSWKTNSKSISALETKAIQLNESAWKTKPKAASDLETKSIQLDTLSWKTNPVALSALETKAIQLTTSAWKTKTKAISTLETKAVQLNVNSWKTKPKAASDLETKSIQLNVNYWKTNAKAISILETKAIQLTTSAWKTKPAASSDLEIKANPINSNLWKETSSADDIIKQKGLVIPITNDQSLELSSSQLDILSWKKQKPITNVYSLERSAIRPIWVSGSNDPFNTIPTDNEYSLKRDATPGWSKGAPGSPYGDPKLDEPAKYSNIRLLEFGIKTIVNSALAPFGTSANNYVKFNLGDSTYDTTPWWSIGSIPLAMLDFRGGAGKVIATLENKSATTFRLDGTSAALRNPWKSSTLYAYLAAGGGQYAVFGRSAPGKKGKGWGDHDSTTAPRLDFTARSNVNTKWNTVTNSWIPTTSITDNITPFRGDKVTVIDFKQNSSLADAYRWKPTVSSKIKVLGKIMDAVNGAGKTSDFIKFYFTGPKILAGDNGEPDDIIAFRAIINRLTDTYNPQYTPVTMIGRADPNFHYSGFGREVGLDFTVYATDRDEMKPIYRKLNALAGYTAPTYSKSSIGLTAPWMRITVGDLLVQQPVLISSLTYGLTDSDTTWEINIEDDPEMMQAPHLITVSMGLTVVSDWIPEKGGRFYSLAKQFDPDGIPIHGDANWLSDFSGNSVLADNAEKAKAAARKAAQITTDAINPMGGAKEINLGTSDTQKILNSYTPLK